MTQQSQWDGAGQHDLCCSTHDETVTLPPLKPVVPQDVERPSTSSSLSGAERTSSFSGVTRRPIQDPVRHSGRTQEEIHPILEARHTSTGSEAPAPYTSPQARPPEPGSALYGGEEHPLREPRQQSRQGEGPLFLPNGRARKEALKAAVAETLQTKKFDGLETFQNSHRDQLRERRVCSSMLYQKVL